MLDTFVSPKFIEKLGLIADLHLVPIYFAF
jgi:hypothetical protein